MTRPEDVMESYLAEVAGRLIGPARARRDILAELAAGIADAADAHAAAGMDPVQAAHAAVAEFGGPDQVAGGFRAELAAAQARRTALTVLTSGPLIGALWVGAALAAGIDARPIPPWHWAGLPAGARPAVHLAMIALAIAIAGTLFTLATTGRLARWLPARPLATAAIAVGGTAPIDITLVTLFAAQMAGAPGRLAVLPAAAATASLGRLAFTARTARDRLIARGGGAPARQ
ncbi:hypothetical protein GCM10023196_104870 [Actinoallomurus vinaceus]|uniref:DUF1700 domain-containing protein n=1 Tax=Actinoallomurus vinaceus TaxID=1080074 RepID=A0ABP8UU38_9ACTN